MIYFFLKSLSPQKNLCANPNVPSCMFILSDSKARERRAFAFVTCILPSASRACPPGKWWKRWKWTRPSSWPRIWNTARRCWTSSATWAATCRSPSFCSQHFLCALIACLFCSAMQNKYRQAYDKSRGKPPSVTTDTPEMIRIRKAQEQLSEVRRRVAARGPYGSSWPPCCFCCCCCCCCLCCCCSCTVFCCGFCCCSCCCRRCTLQWLLQLSLLQSFFGAVVITVVAVIVVVLLLP